MTLQDMHLALNSTVKDIYRKDNFLARNGAFFGFTFKCTYICTHFLKETFLIQSEVFSNFTEAFLVPTTTYPPGFDRVAIDL